MKKLLFLTVSCIVFVQHSAHAMYPLHDAVKANDVALVASLLNNSDTDVNLQDQNGKTPLYITASNGYEAVARLLLKHGANVNQPDNDGKTPLYIAVLRDNEAVARLLLKHGANVNQPDKNGKTPLYWAVSYCNREAAVRLLLKHGANVNQPDNGGWAPLHLAALRGYEAVVRVLLADGANVNQPDNNGCTPLYRAEQNGIETVVRLLQAWSIMQQQACVAAQLAFCTIHHHRVGARSQARVLNPYLIHEILQYVQPADFPAIPAAVVPVVPAPTVSQQALAMAQNILSNPRVQIAAAAIAVLSFVAWRLLHH